MRRITGLTAVLIVLGAACGGGGSSGQAQTEAGAIEAVKQSTEGALRGNSGAVLNFLSEDCRAAIDEDDVKLAIALIPAFFSDLFEFDLKDVDINPSIVSFEGDTARVAVTYTDPDGTEINDLGISSNNIDIMYENGKWVDTGCEFEDTTERDAEARTEALAELGYAATREDPIPRSVGAPIGNGYFLSVDAVNPDAAAAIEAMEDSFVSEIEPGEMMVLLSLTIGYSGSDEPQQLNSFNTQIIGGSSSVGYDNNFGCGSFPTSLNSTSRQFFTGGVTSGDMCFIVPENEIDGMLLSAEGGFGSDAPTIFDPNVVADTPVPVTGSSGPSPDGEYTAARNAPTPLGESVDLGEGWTITILGFQADATAAVVAASDFNDPPPAGTVYSLVEYQLTYDGDEEPQSAFSVNVGVVGNSNVSGENNCSVSEYPNELDRFSDLFKGATVSGNGCFVVDEGDVDSLVVFASADFFSDDKFALAVR